MISPEPTPLVERVARANKAIGSAELFAVPGQDGHYIRVSLVWELQEAAAALLEASHHAELVEAAQRLSMSLHRIEARTATLNEAVGGSGARGLEPPIWANELQAIDALLAKIGGEA